MANESVLRVPPHSIEAEQSVLGGLMLVGEAWDQVADRLTEKDFYRREHQLIFRAIGELATAGVPRDAVTLGEWFERQGKANEVGGAAYLTELASSTPSAANISAYADIVRDKSVQRQLIEVGTVITGKGFEPGTATTAELVTAAEQRVFAIAESNARGRNPTVDIGPALKSVIGVLSERFEHPGQLLGASTGFVDLDRMTNGLQRQNLVVLAGRPSMGKTAMALNMAESVLLRDHRPVLFFSLEMSTDQLALRLLSALARVDQMAMNSGNVPPEDWTRIGRAAATLSTAPLKLDDTGALSPTEMRARARRIKAQCGGLGAVFVDYLQLMSVPGTRENRTNEVSEISRNLKVMAKELDVPVIALAQLNRAVEQRTDKRPVMSDLRESGGIEQDADLILFLYRDEVYNRESNAKGTAEVIIGKQRNGPIGTVRLAFHGNYTRFDNLAFGERNEER